MYRVGSGELLRVCKAFLCVGSLDLGEVHSAKVPQAQPLPLQHPSGAASPSPLKGCVVLQPRSVLSGELGTAGELAPGSAAETVTESEGCTKMALCCLRSSLRRRAEVPGTRSLAVRWAAPARLRAASSRPR